MDNVEEYYEYYNEAEALQEQGKYEEALVYYDKAIQLNPKDEAGWIRKGDTLRDLKRYDEALKCYEQAIELNPKDEWGWLGKGDTLTDLHNYKEALRCYDKAIEVNSRHVWSWLGKGDTLRVLKNYDEALKCYEQAIELNPANEWGWIRKGHAFRDLKSYEEALRWYDEGIKANPNSGILFYHKGLVLNELSRFAPALAAFERAAEIFTDESWIKLTEPWIQSLENKIEEERAKKEPPVEVRIIRGIRESLQKSVDEDPLKIIRDREKLYEEYLRRPRTITEEDCFFTVLRRWNSFTPRIPNREVGREGGGYFLVWKGRGVVIDPGFDFLDNFDSEGYSLRDIDAIVLTHAHIDHTNDLETILSLIHELRNRKIHPSFKVDLFLNLGTVNKFMGWVSRSKGVGRITSLNVGDSIKPRDYDWTLRVKRALHNEVIGRDSTGLVFELLDASKVKLSLGITSDTTWTKEIENQYEGCRMLVLHLGSIGQNEFKERLAMKERLYKGHLGIIGTVSMVKSLQPNLSIISEFGEELGIDKCEIAKNLDRVFRKDKRCITGDIGLKVRLPDLSVYCHVCRQYVSYKRINELPMKDIEEVKYCCQSHTGQELLEYGRRI